MTCPGLSPSLGIPGGGGILLACQEAELLLPLMVAYTYSGHLHGYLTEEKEKSRNSLFSIASFSV